MGRTRHWVALLLLTISCAGDGASDAGDPTSTGQLATVTTEAPSPTTTMETAGVELVETVRSVDLDGVWVESTDTTVLTIAESLCAAAAEVADEDPSRRGLLAAGRFGFIVGGEGDVAEATNRLKVMLSALTSRPYCDLQAQTVIVEVGATLGVTRDPTQPPADPSVHSEEGALAFVSSPTSLPAFDARWQGTFTEPLSALEATLSDECAAVLFRSADLDESSTALGYEPSPGTMFLRWDGDTWLPLSFTLIEDAASMLNGASDTCM